MKKSAFLISLFAALCLALVASAANQKVMTNEDIIKLTKAEFDESTIIATIKSSQTNFDTSADAIIELKNSGVSQNVIKTMLSPQSAAPAPSPKPAASSAPSPAPQKDPLTAAYEGEQGMSNAASFSSMSVYVIASGERQQMQFLSPNFHAKARALGFGGMSSFAVLQGTSATLHIRDSRPVFQAVFPSNVQPNSMVALGFFAVRNNGTREILIGGGYMSYSTGLPKDRNIPLIIKKMDDQSSAPQNNIIYEITPVNDLKRGEYALITSSSQYYDFAVD